MFDRLIQIFGDSTKNHQALEQTEGLEFAAHGFGQGVGAVGFGAGEVGGGGVGFEVAPALEGAGGAAGDGDEGGVEVQAGAGGAVVPAFGLDGGDALADQDAAGDDPVERAAVSHLVGAARKTAGLVAERRGGGEAGGLDGAQVGDVADADGEFEDVKHRGDVRWIGGRGKCCWSTLK